MDIDSKIGSLLSDEESMQQLKELADMLKTEMSSDDTSAASDKSADSSEQSETQDNPTDGGEGDGLFGSMSFDTLLQVGSILSAAGTNDKNRSLLLALKPHVSDGRQDKIDKAVKMLKIYTIVMLLKENGFLKGLDKMI